ncbi:MAG: flavodoxin family protein [candidate division FCPU426 bacterium]
MKKVTAFVGCARKKGTYHSTRKFLDSLQALGGVETELVPLNEYNLGVCRGCKVCFLKGEEFCPLKDDRDALFAKIKASDGVVFATPNYSFQVSGLMKVFLDRLGFVFHRPNAFGKAYTSIVVQGIYGGNKLLSYLDFVGQGLGFNTVKGTCITALEPMTVLEKQKADQAVEKQSRRFYARLMKAGHPVPDLMQVMIFRMGRQSVKLELTAQDRDYAYYAEKGWFTSDYYYPTRLGPLKKLAGNLAESMAKRMVEKRHKSKMVES